MIFIRSMCLLFSQTLLKNCYFLHCYQYLRRCYQIDFPARFYLSLLCLLGIFMTSLPCHARPFVLICHEQTPEEECTDFLSKNPDAISYISFMEAITGTVTRDITQRIFDLQTQHQNTSISNYAQRDEESDELNTLIKETSQGYLSTIKKSLLLQLLVLKSSSIKAHNNSTAVVTPENSKYPKETVKVINPFSIKEKRQFINFASANEESRVINLSSTDEESRAINSPSTKEEASFSDPHSNLNLASDLSQQILVLTEGAIKHPGTLPLSVELHRQEDQLYINGRHIKNELIKTILIYPHLYYHIAYLSNTFKPFFQWSRGDQILPFPKQALVSGDCLNPNWEKGVTETTDSTRALFSASCINMVSRPRASASMLLDQELPKDLTKGTSLNEAPHNFWANHPILAMGAGILAFSFFQKELQKTSKTHLSWEIHF